MEKVPTAITMERIQPAITMERVQPTITMERVQKRRILSLKDKGEIIAEVDRNPHLSKVKLAELFDLPTSTLATILMNRDSILKSIAKCGSASAKRKNSRTSPYQYLEEKLLDWLIDRQEKGYPINSVIIREQAKIMAIDLGLETFTASSGWIDRFKNRHGLGNKAVFDESVAECKNRWASIRDTFPERTDPIRKKRFKRNEELSYTQSIYDPDNQKILGDASATSSQLMPLENSPWSANYPNFPDQSSSDQEPNIHFPEVKLEVDSYDEEDKTDGNHSTTESRTCDYGYIVPNTPFEVEHQPSVSQKPTSVESTENTVQSKKQQESSSLELVPVTAETESKSSEHPIETFFKSMAATVMTFPPHLMAIAKLNVCKLITELELRALTEKNPFRASQERIKELMSENIVELPTTSSVSAENGATNSGA